MAGFSARPLSLFQHSLCNSVLPPRFSVTIALPLEGMQQTASQMIPARPQHGKELCLLSLDGGGVRGLSSLCIIEELMRKVDQENPPKPCDYFDMIGGTSTGG